MICSRETCPHNQYEIRRHFRTTAQARELAVKEIVRIENPVPLRVGYPETKEELEAMFRLRTEVYTKHGYIRAGQDDKDKYDLDNKCVHIIAQINGKLVGTVRGVIDNPLPIEVYFDFEVPKEIASIPPNKRGEISRLIGVGKGMNHLVSLGLIKALIEFARENDILGGYASLMGGFVQTLLSMGIPIHPIGFAGLKYDKGLLHNYFHKGDAAVPIYYFRDEAAEFMEKMKL